MPHPRILIGLGIALILTSLVWTLAERGDREPAGAFSVTWDEREGNPACRYDASKDQVDVRLTVDGDAQARHDVTVTVSAYADENTSELVGSASRTFSVEGVVHRRLSLIIDVDKPPHVGEDDVAACKLAVK